MKTNIVAKIGFRFATAMTGEWLLPADHHVSASEIPASLAKRETRLLLTAPH